MQLVCALFQVYFFVLLARVIFSLVEAYSRLPDGLVPVYKVVYDLTEPIIAPVRRIIPPVGMLDLSFLVVFIVLRMAAGIICS